VIISSSDSWCCQIDPPFAATAGAIDSLVGAIDPLPATAVYLTTNTYESTSWKEKKRKSGQVQTGCHGSERLLNISMLMDQQLAEASLNASSLAKLEFKSAEIFWSKSGSEIN
jgi:hypothetical protein